MSLGGFNSKRFYLDWVKSIESLPKSAKKLHKDLRSSFTLLRTVVPITREFAIPYAAEEALVCEQDLDEPFAGDSNGS